MKRSGPTNHDVRQLVEELKDNSSPFWKRISKDLQKPTRQRRIVNVYKIDKNTKEGDMVIVPGKVLSVGELSKKVDVVAMHISAGAREKITKANGTVLTIKELLQKNPEGKGVRILG